jgi:hypothetical protein
MRRFQQHKSNSCQRSSFILVELKNCRSILHLCGAAGSVFCQPGPMVNISERNGRIALENFYIVWTQVKGIDYLNAVEFLSIRQSGAIG